MNKKKKSQSLESMGENLILKQNDFLIIKIYHSQRPFHKLLARWCSTLTGRGMKVGGACMKRGGHMQIVQQLSIKMND